MTDIGKPLPCGSCPTSERAKRGPKGRMQLHCDLSGQTCAASGTCNATTPKVTAAGRQMIKVLADRKAVAELETLGRLVTAALASLAGKKAT